MLQVGALRPLRLSLGQLNRGQPVRQPVEADDLQRILPESGLNKLIERQRGLLHRSPTSVMHHGERQVNAEGHSSAGSPLGFGDLEVIDQQGNTVRSQPRSAQGIGDRTRRIDRQLVTEDPRPGQARRLISRTRLVLVVIAVVRAVELCEHSPERSLPKPSYRPRGQP